MPINHTAIRQAMRNTLLTVSGITESLIAAENRPFVPPITDTVYYEEKYAPIDERRVATGTDAVVGYYMVFCIFPKGKGTELLEAAADAIKSKFPGGSAIQHAGTNVSLDWSQRGTIYDYDSGPSEEGKAWVALRVTIQYRCYSIN